MCVCVTVGAPPGLLSVSVRPDSRPRVSIGHSKKEREISERLFHLHPRRDIHTFAYSDKFCPNLDGFVFTATIHRESDFNVNETNFLLSVNAPPLASEMVS